MEGGEVSGTVEHIAQAVAGVGDDEQLFALGGAGLEIFAAHAAGHEAIVIAVNEQNGYVAAPERIGRGGGVEVKAAEELCADARDGVYGRDRNVMIAQDGKNDILRRGVAAVGDYTGNGVRQRQRRGLHHNRCLRR